MHKHVIGYVLTWVPFYFSNLKGLDLTFDFFVENDPEKHIL